MKFTYSRFVLALLFPLVATLSCTRSCSPAANKNNIITVDVASPIEALDPRYTTSATAQRVANLLYGSLFDMGIDLLPKPFLVESVINLSDVAVKLILKERS